MVKIKTSGGDTFIDPDKVAAVENLGKDNVNIHLDGGSTIHCNSGSAQSVFEQLFPEKSSKKKD